MEIALSRAENFEPQAMLALNLADQVHGWSAMCAKVLAWERDHILLGTPTEKERENHRAVLKLLLRWTRFLQSMLADPDLSERSLLAEIEGRVLQLESSWQAVINPIDAKEAANALRQAFNTEPDKEFLNKLFPETSK
jgi:hypothetical protein